MIQIAADERRSQKWWKCDISDKEKLDLGFGFPFILFRMDKCLIEALAVQAKNGNKVDKCFNDKAYTAACVAVNTRFNLNLTSQKAINRLKTIKKRYRVMRDILSRDGFWWNSSTKMIDCESDELWRRYIAVSPIIPSLLLRDHPSFVHHYQT